MIGAMTADHRTAALILAGHGSKRHPAAAIAAKRHAVALAARGQFAEVHAGFLRQAPALPDLVAETHCARTYIVPLLTAAGYVTGTVIPEVLGLQGPVTRRPDGRVLHYCEPVGSHQRFPALVAARVRAVAEEAYGLPLGTVEVVIVGHGSGRDDASAQATLRLVESVRRELPAAQVAAAFIDQEPLLGSAGATTERRHLVVVPYLFGAGRHGVEDIPAMLGVDADAADREELAAGLPQIGPFALGGRQVWICRAIGWEPEIADFILDMVNAFDRRHPGAPTGNALKGHP